MNWNCSLVWKLNPAATCRISNQHCQMLQSLWFPVANSATFNSCDMNCNSIFNHSFLFFFLNTNSSVLLTTYETAAVDRFIQTHSLGPGFLNGFHDGIHVEVAFTGGSWANTDRLIRHFHVNLKRQISALTDPPSKKNYLHLQVYTNCKSECFPYHLCSQISLWICTKKLQCNKLRSYINLDFIHYKPNPLTR